MDVFLGVLPKKEAKKLREESVLYFVKSEGYKHFLEDRYED
ncbi:MAG: hypothetical protein BAJALOKI2v1_70018 [Promethearchaeota archaeon]|nr:MAG: hypothetical protein BAJALOKI2v1_70018 [Candidatus Lokiarchaeota archaeon]